MEELPHISTNVSQHRNRKRPGSFWMTAMSLKDVCGGPVVDLLRYGPPEQISLSMSIRTLILCSTATQGELSVVAGT